MTATQATADERLAPTPFLTTLLRRPELGAAAAALAVFLFFSLYTDQFFNEAGSWLGFSCRFGIMAVAVALLMIGGEFDLSTGVMTGTTGLIVGVATTHYGLNIWVAVLVSLLAALAIEGAIFRLAKGLADRGARSGFASLTGSWPGDDPKQVESD